METHGTTYFIYGNEIDFNSKNMPIKKSVKRAQIGSAIRLIVPILLYGFVFFGIKKFGLNEEPIPKFISSEGVLALISKLLSFTTAMSLMLWSFGFIFFKLGLGNPTLKFSNIYIGILTGVSFLMLLPMLSDGQILIIFVAFLSSNSFEYSKRLIGLMKFSKGKWKPEYLYLYQDQKIGDWFAGDIKVVPGPDFSQEESPDKGRDVK